MCNCKDKLSCEHAVAEFQKTDEFYYNELVHKVEQIFVEDEDDEYNFATGDRVRTYKVWDCKFNEDTCQFCKDLHGQKVRFNNTFKLKGYNINVPPSHKGCNCSWHKVKE